MKRIRQFAAILLCFALLIGSVPMVFAAGDSSGETDKATGEWEEIQSIISQYYGEWNDTAYSGAVSSRIPNTALLGNGDVGISSAGSSTTKQFMISKGDFWEYNGNPSNGSYGSPMLIGTCSISEGTVTQKDEGEINLATSYKAITYSSQYVQASSNDYFYAKDAVDGTITHNETSGDGWVSNVPFNGAQWFALEFEEPITFQRFKLYNDGYVRPSQRANNTKNFEIQTKDTEGEAWKTVSSTTNNTEDVCDVSLDNPVTAKYVRVLITSPGGAGDRARVVEFELYKKPNQGENLTPKCKTVTCSSEYHDIAGDGTLYAAKDAADGVIHNVQGKEEGWCTNAQARGTEHWLQLEYADAITFQRYVIYNDGYTRPSEKANNTEDFKIQVKNSETDGWTTVSQITGNTKDVCDVSLENPVTAKFVRVLITSPGGVGDRARIAEFELYEKPGVAEKSGTQNLAKGAVVYTCGAFVDQGKTWSGDYLADGITEAGTKWCCVPGSGGHDDKSVSTHWAILDLGTAKSVGYYKLAHAGVNNEANHNTPDYQLQYLETTETLTKEQLAANSDWITLDQRTGNTQTYTSRSFDPVCARYFRLYITKADNANNAARIHELELYARDPSPYFYEKEDILNAEIDTEMDLGGQRVAMQTWMAATENVMVTRLTNQGTEAVDLKIDLAGSNANPSRRPVTAETNPDGSVTITRTTALDENNLPKSELVQSVPYRSQVAVSAKVVGADSICNTTGTTAELGFALKSGATAYLVTAIGGGGQTYDQDGKLWEGRTEPKTEAAGLLEKYSSEEDLLTLHAAHLNWWKTYWMASYISLDTSNADLATIQKYYYAAQYLLGSSVREGKVASGLYGIWHTNDSPNWHSDFHLNYNFIATYYGLATSNRVSMLLPAAEALTDYIPQGKANAASVQQLRAVYSSFVDQLIDLGQVDAGTGIQDAILFPVAIGPYGMTLENNSYHHETVNAPYSIYPLIEYYNYTLDQDFLKESLYPYLELVNSFAAHWLIQDEDGGYTLYAGYNEGSWAKNSAIELAAYKNCLRYGIQFSRQLGDENWKIWEPIYNGLADQPVVENYNGTGKTVLALAEQEWNGSSWVNMTSPVPGDGNCLPLDSMLPGEVFGYYSSDADLQILQNTVDVFSERGAWTQINNFARLGTDAVNCRYSASVIVEKFAAAIRKHMKNNMMIDDGTHGIEKAGATETVNNMLLLEDQGVIKLFGNWLENADAKFVRLRAPGAFVFSAEYDGEKKEIAEGVTMLSETGATATVASLWNEGMTVLNQDGKPVKLTKGTAPNHPEEVTYTFDTVAGGSYTFVKGETEIDELADARQNAIDELGQYKKSLNDLTEKESTEIDGIIEDATEKISTAVTEDEISRIVKTAKNAMNRVAKKRKTAHSAQSGIQANSTAKDLPFIDVSQGDWFYEGVAYTYENGLMGGVSEKNFAPMENTTRAMVITILYRKAGSPAVHSDGAAWWSDARAWAMKEKISDGTNMEASVTREQLAALLYRYEQYCGHDVSARSDLGKFADGDKVSAWAREAMEWAVAEGVITGKSGNLLDPQGFAIRAEIATMLMRLYR